MERYTIKILVLTLLSLLLTLKTTDFERKIEEVEIFEKWILSFKKTYNTPEEKEKRFKIFIRNLREIESFNDKKGKDKSYHLKITKFADQTKNEFKNSISLLTKKSKKAIVKNVLSQEKKNQEVIDWRKIGAITEIKHQSPDCPASWAYSIAESLESSYFLSSGTLLSFSPQQIIDCSSSYGNAGCNTGRTDFSLNYLLDEGIVSLSEYPSSIREERCKTTLSMKKHSIVGYSAVKTGEDNLEKAVLRRPVSVSINAAPLAFYSGGVYDNYEECPENVQGNVGMVVVGIGEDDKGSFWILKNSWGEEWGENGFLRLRKKSGNNPGICGLSFNAVYPFVKF